MDKTQFLTIFCSYGNLAVVTQTLPNVLAETKRNDARLIVHDSTEGHETQAKWDYLKELNQYNDFFLILSSNMSMAHARNMCLQLGQELYAPDIICMLEDDHAYKEDFIPSMTKAITSYYGKKSPNNLRYGLFSGCTKHNKHINLKIDKTNHLIPKRESEINQMGKANSCCRCAPTSHWNNVLKGYDTDEYLISPYQTKLLNYRNYFKGFISMVIESGMLMYDIDSIGRGFTSASHLSLWDDDYTASDFRSKFLGKSNQIDLPQKLFEIFKDDTSNLHIVDEVDRVNILVTLTVITWNYTITKDEDSLKNLIKHFKNSLSFNILEELIMKFIKKKSELFPHDKRLVKRCHVSQKDSGEFKLEIEI